MTIISNHTFNDISSENMYNPINQANTPGESFDYINSTNKESEEKTNNDTINNSNSDNITVGKHHHQNEEKKGRQVFFTGNIKQQWDKESTISVPMQREIEDAADLGMNSMKELIDVKEPLWYQLGLTLDRDDPATHVANFGKPNRKASGLLQFGYATLEATRKLSEIFPENVKNAELRKSFQSRILQEDCPIKGIPQCPPSTKVFRTFDGTCNNFEHPWWGASLLPMERFLPPKYDDEIQEVRKSKSGRNLPSARDISVRIHRDKNHELPTVTLMFMQWGQFIDHDLISTVKSRSFNGSVPRCCDRRGLNPLPLDLMHPSCLPIQVSNDDWLLSRFGIKCLEFIRSAPATRIDCDLGHREQMNQVSSYLDGSAVYGSDLETSDSIRTFRNGKLQYGRPLGNGPLNPPDPPGGELCRSGALTTECFEGGDGRFGEQIGLTAIHTVWIRYHNRLATTLGKMNKHWSDERIFQETRKIIGALIQHITYREFLPIVVGPEVMKLFEINLKRKGFFNGYDERVNPSIANAFGTAAFRFGHSLVQNSYMRFDRRHRPLFNNVSIHEELNNFENIWSIGSVDRLLLGFVNQPTQKRDEFICEELTNNLFKSPRAPFGVDLAAINIQRGRDHGIPAYTSWRKPCGLSEIKDWNDLQKVLNLETVQRLRNLYEDIDDIDLFTAGLAEKPVRGGIVGPTFACIIAQQFSNLRKGDRLWYENPGFRSSFTQAQLNQIKRLTFSEILCQTMSEFETVQPFVFLSADEARNVRSSCDSPLMNKFDLAPWTEDIEPLNDEHSDTDDMQNRNIKDWFDFGDEFRAQRDVWEARKRKKSTTTRKPNVPKRRLTATVTKVTKPNTIKIPIRNITVHSVEKNYGNYFNNYDEMPNPQFSYYNDPPRQTTQKYYSIRDKNEYTYLFGRVSSTTPVPWTRRPNKSQTPLEVNIKIQYYPPTPTPKRKQSQKQQQTIYARPQNSNGYGNGYSNRPTQQRPHSNYDNDIFVIKRPIRRPSSSSSAYSFNGGTLVVKPEYLQKNPENDEYDEQAQASDESFDSIPYNNEDNDDELPKQDNIDYEQQDDETYDDEKSDHHYLETELNESEEQPEIDRRFITQNKRKFGTESSNKGNPYSIAYIEKLSSHDENDKLDFRTQLVYKRKYHKPTKKNNDDADDGNDDDDDDDDGYISSEDDEETFEDERQQKASYRKLPESNEHYDTIRLVDLSIMTDEKARIRWKPCNETQQDEIEDFIMPDLPQNGASDEIPTKLTTVN